MNALIALYESLKPLLLIPRLLWETLWCLLGIIAIVLTVVLLPVIFWRKYNAVKARRGSRSAAPKRAVKRQRSKQVQCCSHHRQD